MFVRCEIFSKTSMQWFAMDSVIASSNWRINVLFQGGQPLGAINLTEYTVVQFADPDRPHSFKVSKKGSHSVFLAAISSGELDQWLTAISEACKPQVGLTIRYFGDCREFIKMPSNIRSSVRVVMKPHLSHCVTTMITKCCWTRRLACWSRKQTATLIICFSCTPGIRQKH